MIGMSDAEEEGQFDLILGADAFGCVEHSHHWQQAREIASASSHQLESSVLENGKPL